MKDEKVVQQLRKGDYSVFKYLYVHYRTIEKYVIANNGHREDAKDLFQNTLIIFYQMTKKEDFQLSSAIGTLLFGIAKRNWLKQITRKREFARAAEEQIVEEKNHDASTKDPFVWLKEIMQKIGDPCKSLIMLFHFDQLSWDDIASRLNYANAHAARQQKYKCFLKIRKSIPETLQQEIIKSVS